MRFPPHPIKEYRMNNQSREFFAAVGGSVKKYANPFHKAYVYEDYRAIYFPIAKVASSNIKAHFFTNISEPPKRLVRIQYNRYENYFKFGFVRNPYDRLVSCYTDKTIRKPNNKFIARYDGRFYGGMSFSAFVRAVATLPPSIFDQHLATQSSTLFNNGKLLVDFVGKFENLNSDLLVVARAIGCDADVLPEAGNKSRGRTDYQSYYDEETRSIAEKIYRDDLENFDYQF